MSDEAWPEHGVEIELGFDAIGETLEARLAQGVEIDSRRIGKPRPAQDGGAGLAPVKQAVNIGSENPIVGRNRPLWPAVDRYRGPSECGPLRHPHMNLVAAEGRLAVRPRKEDSLDIAKLLLRLERRLEVQQGQAAAASRRALHAERIVDAAAKHLHAAAQPDHLAAVARVTKDCFAPARLFQVAEISAHVLAAGQNDEIG